MSEVIIEEVGMTKEEAVNVFDVAVRGASLPANVEELVPLSFIGQTAVKYYRDKVALMNKLGVAEDQKKATLQDGRDAAEMLYNIESRIGELLPTPEETKKMSAAGSPVMPDGNNRRTGGVKVLPDGVTSKTAHIARTLASPEGKLAWEEVKKEAEENEDIPTKTAVLNKVKHKRAEEKAAMYKAKVESQKLAMGSKISTAPYDVQQYILSVEESLLALPKTPPADGWDDATMDRMLGLAATFAKRLSRFMSDDINIWATEMTRRLGIEESV